MMDIPFFRYPHVFRESRGDIEQALVRAAERGSYIMQRELRQFEEQLAAYCGTKHAIGVGNATDGLELILEAVGVGSGDEVILPSHTFVASASAVVRSGARPVLAEVGTDHLLDPSDVVDRISARTRAVMPTQLNGRTASMDQIAATAEANGAVVLEDSAQGLGSRFKGAMAGTFGAAGVYSFYPAKVLGGLGDGGAVVTDDDGLAEEIRCMRDHGRDPDTGEVVCWGRNSRLDNLQAAVLLVKLRRIEDAIGKRRALARRYDTNLRGVPQVTLPEPPATAGADHFDTYQNYEIEAENRNALRT